MILLAIKYEEDQKEEGKLLKSTVEKQKIFFFCWMQKLTHLSVIINSIPHFF